MLHDFITENRSEIIARTRAISAARTQSIPTEVEADRGIPLFLAELTQTLKRAQPNGVAGSAAQHGSDLLRMGFTISQVVHGYGDVCQVVTELALESATPIGTEDFRTFNRCLDEAIASAVTEYARQREEGISRKGTERLGTLAHELRNSLSTALLAFGTLKRGVVGPESSTGAVLNRSLQRLRDLIDRSLSEVRLEAGLVHVQQVSVFDLVQEVAIGTAADATQRGVFFRVAPFTARLEVKADRQLLIGAVENILQNALKFTPKGGHICLSAMEADDRVILEVEDECGGLPSAKIHSLFNAFAQQGGDRTGLGLGLWISRASLATFGGTLAVRDVPRKGCVFSVSIPSAKPTEGGDASRAGAL